MATQTREMPIQPVATTVPTSPRATSSLSFGRSIRPRVSHGTAANGNCSTPLIRSCV